MASGRPSAVYDGVVERRPAVALAHHVRETEEMSIAQIADRLGRSPATIKGVLLRPDGRESQCSHGPLSGAVPGLWRVHPSAQRQGRRLRVLQALSSRRDQAEVDAGVADLGDAGVARAVWPVAVVLRLVADPCPPARCPRASSPERGPVAAGQRRQRPVRDLGYSASGGRHARRRRLLA